jgi:hypothetical protein
MWFDVSAPREQAVDGYRDYVASFINILDDQIDTLVRRDSVAVGCAPKRSCN